MKAILLVGTGGFLGSVLRYLCAAWVFRIFDKPWFPVGTLAVNLLGCLVIGLLGGLAEQRRLFDQEVRLFVFVGILGGFTTFSAFAYETSILLRDTRPLAAWLNVGLQVFLGLFMVWLGGWLSRLVPTA
ncbi:MAG: fluoride efflux transporter CrcB [Deltaproteobacteria bacterium]|nr:fluoride efflux transporter CrcB [Deltaproteobacteria bacterium]